MVLLHYCPETVFSLVISTAGWNEKEVTLVL